MKDLKEYINESTGITADKLKELALEKADKGKGDGWIYFKKPIVINDTKFIAISDDGQNCKIDYNGQHIEMNIKFISSELDSMLYNELKKL